VTRTVPEELGGQRVDKIVAVLAGLSRSAASRLIVEGAVQVAGRVVSGNDRLEAGVDITFAEPGPDPEMEADASVPFVVRYEDESLAVVDKPSGIVVHPGAGRERSTLAAGLLARWPEIRGVGEAGRWGVVHRLDRETSGVLLVAKTGEAHAALQRAILERRVSRRYQALLHGRLAMTTGTVDAPIGRDPSRATRMSVQADGRPARTHYTLKAVWGGEASLVEVSLETGRTHQIRVHFASIGHAVYDDGVYGTGGPSSGAGRLWLHAHRLELTHPLTGAGLIVASPLPVELKQSLIRLGAPDIGSVDE
jgi:23S rRNA pseudouridine1911/1915/1917 synthase